MKKLLLGLLVAGILLTGCSKKDEPKPAKDVNLSELMTKIQNNTEIELPKLMLADKEAISSLYNIKEGDTKQAVMALAMINVQADEVIMVQASSDKMPAVKEALDQRMKTVESNWEHYLPEQYDLVKNRKTYENGEYYAIVISRNADKIIAEIENAFK